MGLAFYCLYSLSLDATKVNKEFLTRPKTFIFLLSVSFSPFFTKHVAKFVHDK